MQGASTKNNDFQNAIHSLDTFMDNLPNNKIRPSDNVAEVKAKQTSQEVSGRDESYHNTLPAQITALATVMKHIQFRFFLQRVVEDIKRKGYEVDRMVDLSQDLQDILNVSWNLSFIYRSHLRQ